MNFKVLAQHFVSALSPDYDAEEAAAIFGLVAEHTGGRDRGRLLRDALLEVPEADLSSFLQILDELKRGKPVQYILGETQFFGLRFKVNPAVLIPRPETEELVDWIVQCSRFPDARSNGFHILDIGTGSGCIAVSLKKQLPGANVSALDISAAAIQVAADNAAINQVVVQFIEADIREYSVSEKFDVIVSNPPYITQHEQQDMQGHVLNHEPHLALFVSDENPLEFYKAIADFALLNLAEGGRLFFEINASLGKETVAMLMDKSFKNIDLRKDIQGKDRMICCTL